MYTERQKNTVLIDLDQRPIVFDSISNGIAITNDHSTILYVNAAFTRITGYSFGEALGNNPGMLHSGRHDAAFYQTMWDEILKHGFWEGEIWNRRKSGEIYPEFLTISKVLPQEGVRPLYIAIFSDITFLKKDTDKTFHLAFYDPLTELPNRALYLDRLKEQLKKKRDGSQVLGVFYMDLDKFKPVNDQYGHCVGDKLLKVVGERLLAVTRSGDTVARLGGDEFAGLLILKRGKEDAVEAAKHIVAHLEAPIEIGDLTLQVSVSIGISIYPFDGIDVETLLAHADEAMYRAKKSGCRIECYS